MNHERGQALIETVLVGLLLMIPLVWLLTVLADVHRAALATTAAARGAGGDAARTTSAVRATGAIDRAVAAALADHGMTVEDARVRSNLPPGFERGGAIEIEVSYPIPLLQAPLIGRVGGPALWINARHVARIDLFRSRE